MRTVIRNSFARQTIRAERIGVTEQGPGSGDCAYCGSVRGRPARLLVLARDASPHPGAADRRLPPDALEGDPPGDLETDPADLCAERDRMEDDLITLLETILDWLEEESYQLEPDWAEDARRLLAVAQDRLGVRDARPRHVPALSQPPAAR